MTFTEPPHVRIGAATLLAGMLLACVSPARAQLFTAWSGCNGSPGSMTTGLQFDCTPESGFSAQLVGMLGVPSTLPGIIAADGIIDFTFPLEQDIPEFWRLEVGGCNNAGLEYSFGPAGAACDATNSTALCGASGAECGTGVTAYFLGSQVPLGGPNRTRLYFTNARAMTAPAILPAMPTRNFCFKLTFSSVGLCTGCEAVTSIVWNEVVLYNDSGVNGPEAIAAVIKSDDPGSTGPIWINHDVVDTKKTSWGRLKSMFR